MNIEERIYRTVTSLSYDISNSTALMQQIGTEQYALLIEQVHDGYAEIIAQFDGISAAPQGDDGNMCYFGALSTDEHAKESALMAALAMQRLAKQNNWHIRIGVAYGLVAVYKKQPVGATVHLAVRIQKAAPSQTILVSAELASQTSSRFSFLLFGDSLDFKGFDFSPIVFELKGKVENASVEVEDTRKKAKTYLHGRQAILKDLRSKWEQVQTLSQGHCLHIVGEAGVGKTALIQGFLDTIKQPKRTVFLWSCFQEHQQSAYQPLIHAIMKVIGLSSLEGQDRWAEKIEAKALELGLDNQQKSVLFFLLGMPAPANLPEFGQIEDLTAYEKRVVQTLITWLRFESQHLPWLLIIEDAHWSDPSTRRLIMLLQDEVSSLSGLLLTTQRPSQTDSAPQANVEKLSPTVQLNALSYEDSSALVERLCTGLALEAQEVDWIVERAGGVPLFIHECVRLVKDAKLKSGDKPHKTLASVWLQRATITPFVASGAQEILMQRIDALGDKRIWAQIASAIGSEFELEILLRVATAYGLNTLKLDLLATLSALMRDNIFVAKEISQQQYSFSHALLQDVAYQSMWESDRKKLHAVILEVYEQHFLERMKAQPSQMARHWVAAGNYHNATMCLLDAAQQGRLKGAHQISIECCEAALDLLQSLPEDQTRQKMQLQVSLMAAVQIMATQGYGADGAYKHFRYAQQLSHQLSNFKTLDKTQLGLCAYYLTRAEFSEADHLIRSTINSPSVVDDALSQLQWRVTSAMLHFYRGELVPCSELMAQCVLHSRQIPKSNQLIQSPQVVGQMYQAFCLWAMGNTETACEMAQQGLLLSEQQPLRLGKIQAFGIWAMILYCRGEWQSALTAAQTALGTSQEGEYELWLNLSQFIAGAASVRLAMHGDISYSRIKQGLAQMHAVDQSWVGRNAVVTRSFYLCILAQCHLDLKQYGLCQSYIEQADALVQKHAERYFSTEVQRTQAALLMATQTAPDWADLAKTALNQSFEDARTRGLHSYALRVALTMIEWEQLTQRACEWSGNAKAAKVLLTECLERMEPFASTQDAVLAHRLLNNNA